MNVAELEAALIELESESKFRRDSAYDELAHHAASLARRVIAAEKLVEAMREVAMEAWGYEHLFETEFHSWVHGQIDDAVREYEASK